MEKNNVKYTFDPNNITKYFKDQVPPTNLSQQFVDPFFPPNENSLMAKKSNGEWIGNDKSKDAINLDTTVWKSAKQIFEDAYSIFQNIIECDDIKQGSLGNCYFLSAISSLTEFPQLIYQLFRTKEVSNYGYYEVVLFIEGEWQVVILDDYFPVYSTNNSYFVFADKPVRFRVADVAARLIHAFVVL